MRTLRRLRALWEDESGVTAIEYALIASLVAIAAIAALTNLGDAITEKFEKIIESLKGADVQETTSGSGG